MKTKEFGAPGGFRCGHGCMGISHAAGNPMDTEDAVRLIREAADMGYTFLTPPRITDTWSSPTTMKKYWERRWRESGTKVVVATKCGGRF